MASISGTNSSEGERKNTIPLTVVSGINFRSDNVIEKSVKDTIDFKPTKGDIFLVSYPKAGSTWTQYILWSIMNKGEPLPELWQMMTKLVPYLELSGTEVTMDLPKPRIMKTHLPFQKNPYHPEAKYIYVARNIKDVCVSYYHFCKRVVPTFQDGTLDEFFELYIDGKVVYGPWYEHVYSWYGHKDDRNVLILTFEWMKNNHAEAVLKIASFVGEEYREELEKNPSLLKKIVENTTFEAMKKMRVKKVKNFNEINKELNEEKDCESTTKKKEPQENINFFRKGQFGDWRNHLSASQEKRLNEKLFSQSDISSVMTLWGDLWTTEDLITNC